MNNPFLRFKHYTVSATDPQARAIKQQENHATECLAACLVFSSKVRAAVIEYLLGDDKMTVDSSEFDVVTQQPIEGGYIDLLLHQNGKFVIAVEVKVKSPEDCDHHRNQLRNYRKWIDKHESLARLFTLVRHKDDAFRPQKYGADGRRNWLGLYKRFQALLRHTDDAESSLIKNFCDYLEVESIVSDWEPKQILDYGNGVVARKALGTLFGQLAEKLSDLDKGYLTRPVMKDDEWPRLEIGMKSWSPIFGSKAYLNKLRLYYETVAVPLWEGKAERFNFEIVLWDKWEKGEADWRKIQPQLPRWVPYLKSHDVYHKAYGRGNRELEGKSAEEGRFTEPPSWISAWARDPKDRYIEESDWLKMNEEELLTELFRRALHHCEIISGLQHS